MKRTYFVGLTVFAVVIFGIGVAPETMAKDQGKERVSVKIKGATPDNPSVYLGKKYDTQAGIDVEGYAIVHYAKSIDRPIKPSSGNTCYGFLASGAKWKVAPEGWVVNTTNTEGLRSDFIVSNLGYDIQKWEGFAGRSILGSGASTSDALIPDETAPDNVNEVVFGDVDSPGAIAVTIVWGVFGGSPSKRQLTEWDMIFDETDFDWTENAILEPTRMDFENIATHELGHAMGMGDLYTSKCNQETMFGYAENGETKKRDLNVGDSIGIGLLY